LQKSTPPKFPKNTNAFIIKKLNYCFTPQPNLGAKHPKHEQVSCYGYDLSNSPFQTKIDVSHLIKAYALTKDKSNFFNPFFVKLAGTKTL